MKSRKPMEPTIEQLILIQKLVNDLREINYIYTDAQLSFIDGLLLHFLILPAFGIYIGGFDEPDRLINIIPKHNVSTGISLEERTVEFEFNFNYNFILLEAVLFFIPLLFHKLFERWFAPIPPAQFEKTPKTYGAAVAYIEKLENLKSQYHRGAQISYLTPTSVDVTNLMVLASNNRHNFKLNQYVPFARYRFIFAFLRIVKSMIRTSQELYQDMFFTSKIIKQKNQLDFITAAHLLEVDLVIKNKQGFFVVTFPKKFIAPDNYVKYIAKYLQSMGLQLMRLQGKILINIDSSLSYFRKYQAKRHLTTVFNFKNNIDKWNGYLREIFGKSVSTIYSQVNLKLNQPLTYQWHAEIMNKPLVLVLIEALKQHGLEGIVNAEQLTITLTPTTPVLSKKNLAALKQIALLSTTAAVTPPTVVTPTPPKISNAQSQQLRVPPTISMIPKATQLKKFKKIYIGNKEYALPHQHLSIWSVTHVADTNTNPPSHLSHAPRERFVLWDGESLLGGTHQHKKNLYQEIKAAKNNEAQNKCEKTVVVATQAKATHQTRQRKLRFNQKEPSFFVDKIKVTENAGTTPEQITVYKIRGVAK